MLATFTIYSPYNVRIPGYIYIYIIVRTMYLQREHSDAYNVCGSNALTRSDNVNFKCYRCRQCAANIIIMCPYL